MTAATVENQEFYINFDQKNEVLEADERTSFSRLTESLVRLFPKASFDRIVIQKEPPFPGMKSNDPGRELYSLFFFVRRPSSPSEVVWHPDRSFSIYSPPHWTFEQFLEEAENIRGFALDDLHFCYDNGRLCLTSSPIRA